MTFLLGLALDPVAARADLADAAFCIPAAAMVEAFVLQHVVALPQPDEAGGERDQDGDGEERGGLLHGAWV